MLTALKEEVWEANLELQKRGLILFTWGNASAVDREKGLMIIKPSGIEYDLLRPNDMVVLDLSGKQVEGKLCPSSDTPTHLVLYQKFPEIGGVVHTHSSYATMWAQAGKSLPAVGTTHADYFYGAVPCTRKLTAAEIGGSYEEVTGRVIVETFQDRNPLDIPGVLVESHGPFTWGKNVHEAVYHAVVLEEIAKLAMYTRFLSPEMQSMDPILLDKHFLRKHGKQAYYGQAKQSKEGGVL